MFLYDVTTPAEIEETFGLPTGSVRRDLHRNRFRKSEIRKSGSTWLITWREAKRIYKGEFTMIPVKNNWDWIVEHCDGEINEKLIEDIKEYTGNPYMDRNDFLLLYREYEAGMDGVDVPEEGGEYLPFSQWFYEYWEGIKEAEESDRE